MDIDQKQQLKKIVIGAAATVGVGAALYLAYKTNAIGKIREQLEAGKILTGGSEKVAAEKDMQSDTFRMGIYSIVRRESDSKQLIERFASKGYDAIEDYFDKGAFTESPIILFNPATSVVKTGETLVTEAMKQAARQRLDTLNP